jgi:hypothetical protein
LNCHFIHEADLLSFRSENGRAVIPFRKPIRKLGAHVKAHGCDGRMCRRIMRNHHAMTTGHADHRAGVVRGAAVGRGGRISRAMWTTV